nr:hypothetical protein [Tanacetum cinerariifolium]
MLMPGLRTAPTSKVGKETEKRELAEWLGNMECEGEISIPDLEPFINQTIEELPQTLPSFDSTCYSKDGNSFTYDSTSNLVHDSSNVFDPPPQPQLYSCEFCGNNARYGHYCTPQVPFIYPKPCKELSKVLVSSKRELREVEEDLVMRSEDGVGLSFNASMLAIKRLTFNNFLRRISSLIVKRISSSIPHTSGITISINSELMSSESGDQFKDFSNYNDESTSTGDDSFSIENIEYVEASPLDSELISSELIEIVIPEVGGIDDDILLTIKDDILRFDSTCYSKDGNSFTYDSTSNLVHDSSNVFDPPPQPQLYSCEFCGNNARYGHYCTPQVPFIYPKPCYNQDFNFPQDFHDFQQQHLCCENCGEEEKQIEEEQAANARYWKIPACHDDDDDDYTFAITHKEPDNSLSMRNSWIFKTRARGLITRSSHPQLHFGNPISKSYRLTILKQAKATALSQFYEHGV